jgi:hypothetical protein
MKWELERSGVMFGRFEENSNEYSEAFRSETGQ